MPLQAIVPTAQIETDAILHPLAGRGIVSLYDMTRFYGDLFVKTLAHIIQWEVKCSRHNPSSATFPGIAVEIYAYVGTITPELILIWPSRCCQEMSAHPAAS